MLGNPMWIWVHWPYHAEESSWCGVGFIAYLTVGGLLASYLPSYFFSSSKEKISWRESNYQPLRSKMSTFPLSPSSLGSSQTWVCSYGGNLIIITLMQTIICFVPWCDHNLVWTIRSNPFDTNSDGLWTFSTTLLVHVRVYYVFPRG